MKFSGDKLRNVRKDRDISIYKLSNIVGIKESTISDYELGKIKPGVEALIDIANALNVSVDSFYVKDFDE